MRSWKKVYESDLDSILMEFMDSVESPSVLILEGDLGAGKTTFTKKFINSIYPEADVSSPTYSLVQDIGEVVHADFYRIEDSEEILHLELPLYLEDKNYFIVEWGAKWKHEIEREVSDNFHFYQVNIEINPLKEGEEFPSRNYFLFELET